MENSDPDHKADFARNHRFRFKLGDETLLYIQSLAIKKEPTFWNKGILEVNTYFVFKEDVVYLLTSKSKTAQITFCDGVGNSKIVLKLSGVKCLNKGYSKLIMDYTQTDIAVFPITFSFKKIEVISVDR